MSNRPKGKYVTIDNQAPNAVGICDYSGFVFNRVDLIKQMEWRGNRLVWTGFYVGRPFVDVPNEQLRPPMMRPDPIPIQQPRLPQGYVPYWNTTFTLWDQTQVTWASDATYSDGIPTPLPPITIAELEAYNWSTAG